MAVGYLGDDPVIGTSCSRGSAVGIFRQVAGGWQLIGPQLHPESAGAPSEVLGLWPREGGVAALIGTSSASAAELRASWTTNGSNWQSSPPLAVARAQHLVSFGPAGGAGLFVLLGGPGGAEQLEVVDQPGDPWQRLPAPPGDTATVAISTRDVIDALAASKTVLSVWTLPSPSRGWIRIQVLHVAIQFGSSNP